MASCSKRGLRVPLQKCDPYLSRPRHAEPYQHGKCTSPDDGARKDLDLGHYERSPRQDDARFTIGRRGEIYESIISKERRGRLPGKNGR